MPTSDTSSSWSSAWPDALAFAFGLTVAWVGGWTATDLVWSLWLSSLVVGYLTIVWNIVRPGATIGRAVWRGRALDAQSQQQRGPSLLVAGAVGLVGALFMLAFFTVHFGMFHFVHSQFLAMFFPVTDAPSKDLAGVETYLEVVRRYWMFLPAAFLAERAGFKPPAPSEPDDGSVTASAIERRKAANTRRGASMMAPYRNVVRMHLLIIFFGFISFVSLENFAIYALVYAVYFFPWRLVRRPGGELATE